MKEKKNEKDLSILDSKDVEIDAPVEKNVDVKSKVTEATETAVQVKEKKKIKPWILITSIALIVAIIAVGVFTWYQYTTLATYDGGRVTRAELNKYFEATILAEGITEDVLNDPAMAENIQMFKDELLISLANDEVLYKQLKNLDVGQLSTEQLIAIEQDAKSVIDGYVEENLASITAGLPEGYSDRDLANAKKDFETTLLNQNGFLKFEDFLNLQIKREVFLTAYEELLPLEQVAPTDEETMAEYDTLLTSQMTAFDGQPANYLYEAESLNYALYVPEGIRMVRHILILLDDAKASEISVLQSEGKETEADKVYDEALAEIQPQLDDILAQLDAGTISFADAIVEYGQDPGMASNPEGYIICEGYDAYVPEFTEGGLALTAVGEYSELIATSYGYHIIEYFSDMPSEVVPFEDVSDSLYSTLLEANKSTAWLQMLEQWPIELNLQYKDEALNDIPLY